MITPGYTYDAAVVEVHDGDTITVTLDLGLRFCVRKQTIRLARINAPELKVNGEDNPAGLNARDALMGVLAQSKGSLFRLGATGAPIVIQTKKDKTEKYGRWLGEVWAQTANGAQFNVNDWMFANGFAVRY